MSDRETTRTTVREPTLQMSGVLQRKCACGQHTVAGGGCSECEKKKGTLQRRASSSEASEVPPIVHDVLRSAGQPLDASTRAFMEPRFGHDFSHIPARSGILPSKLSVGEANDPHEREADRTADSVISSPRKSERRGAGSAFSEVRVHTDARAAESARAVNANAYTFGNHIAFAQGKYAPDTVAGRRLLAHELTHVTQQSYGRGGLIRRDTSLPGSPGQNADKVEGDEAEGTAAVGGRVKRIVISAADGLIVIETSARSYLYELGTWNIPTGSYTATITIVDKVIVFDFGQQAGGKLFHFKFLINQGQENPVSLLKGQSSVTIDVVPQTVIDPTKTPQPLSCLLPLQDKILIDKKTFSKPLFKPLKKKVEWKFGTIPLGFLGWIEANGEAGISAAGLLSGGYGPGTLSNICLFQKKSKDRFAGTAKFDMSAAISPSIAIDGKLRISADYLGVASLASVEGGLAAKAIGMLQGGIQSNLEVIYDRKTGKWELAAEALISGGAGLKFSVTASAAIKVLWKKVWSEEWKLVDADLHIGWQGGLRIGTDATPRFDFGKVGALSQGGGQATQPPAPSLPTATAPDPLAAEVDLDDVTQQALTPGAGTQNFPRGLSANDPLPFIWYKPSEIYPRKVAIPLANSPHELDRLDGPTPVSYNVGQGAVTANIGVDSANWPYVRKTFDYVPMGAGDREKDALRNVFAERLLPAGQTLRGNGFDLDHVHEKQFGGEDAYHNLWPADYQENQLAGTRHDDQLNHYRNTIGNIAGHWFEIVDIKRASSP